ncbi:flagellar hook-length control protein FliK, partial [Rhodoplanes roseus]
AAAAAGDAEKAAGGSVPTILPVDGPVDAGAAAGTTGTAPADAGGASTTGADATKKAGHESRSIAAQAAESLGTTAADAAAAQTAAPPVEAPETASAKGEPKHVAAEKVGGTSGTAEAGPKTSEARADAPAAPSASAAPAQPTGALQGMVRTEGLTITSTTATGPTQAAGSRSEASNPVTLAGVPVEITSQAKAGKHSFDIRLDPPDMGRIRVQLDVDANGTVVPHITADRADTLDLLRRDAGQLERALQDAGLKTDQGAMQFSLRDQSTGQQQADQDSSGRSARSGFREGAAETGVVELTATYGRLLGRDRGIDIRV